MLTKEQKHFLSEIDKQIQEVKQLDNSIEKHELLLRLNKTKFEHSKHLEFKQDEFVDWSGCKRRTIGIPYYITSADVPLPGPFV